MGGWGKKRKKEGHGEVMDLFSSQMYICIVCGACVTYVHGPRGREEAGDFLGVLGDESLHLRPRDAELIGDLK